MSFPIRRVDAEPGVCKYCRAETHCVHEEYVDDLFAMPFGRKYMWFARCQNCGRLDHRRSDASRSILGKTKGIATWIAGTWILIGLIAATILACALWQDHREHVNALSPVVGDEWIFRTKSWPDSFHGAKYGRAKVVAIHEDAIELMACRMTYDDKRDVRKQCHSYDLAIFGAPRDKLATAYAPAIEDVDSPRDDHRVLYVGFGITAGLILLWRILTQSWKQRIELPEF